MKWPDFIFPPLNLWNIWPRQDQIEYHAQQLDESLFEEVEDES